MIICFICGKQCISTIKYINILRFAISIIKSRHFMLCHSKNKPLVTSLTLTVLSLVDFILDSILEGVCFLLGREVQSDLTVLIAWVKREKTDNESLWGLVTHTNNCGASHHDLSKDGGWGVRRGACLHLQGRYESTVVASCKQSGCRAPAPKPASLSVEKHGSHVSFTALLT